jgi:hypothetical protein
VKKFVISLGIIGVLSLIGYFIFDRYYPSSMSSAWKLVPGSALMVYESDQFVQAWNQWQGSEIWQALEDISEVGHIRQSLSKLDSLSGSNGALDRLLRGRNVLISLHPVAKDKFDYLFVFPLSSAESKNTVDLVRDNFKKLNYRVSERNYRNYTIIEFTEPGTTKTFSFSISPGYFAGSFTSILVEDVIRIADGSLVNPITDLSSGQFETGMVDTGHGRLFINTQKLDQFIGLFSKLGNENWVAHFRQLATFSILQLEQSGVNLELTGKTFTEALPGEKSGFLATMASQKPGQVKVWNQLPQNTAFFFHYSLSDVRTWMPALNTYWNQFEPEVKQGQKDILNRNRIDLSQGIEGMGSELALVIPETTNPQYLSRLIFIEMGDKTNMLSQLERWANQAIEGSGESLYNENFGGSKIGMINIKELPKYTFGSLFTGFNQSFYTTLGDYLVLSNQLDALKKYIVEWEQKQFLKVGKRPENFSGQSNFLFYAHLPRAWNILMSPLSENWKNFFQSNKRTLVAFENIQLQVVNQGKEFKTEIHANLNKDLKILQGQGSYRIDLQKPLLSEIINPPFSYFNQDTRQREILVQDNRFRLFRLSDYGEIYWQYALQSAISSPIYIIDYLGNGKVNYLFAAGSEVHVLDERGNALPGFPDRPLESDHTIARLSVLDYENNKDYKILISDAIGTVHRFDKNMEAGLEWIPLSLEGSLSENPIHLRIRARDYHLLAQTKGFIHVTNSNGENYPNFPIDLKHRLANPFYIERGNSAAETTLSTISESGELIAFNLEGRITRRDQLLRPSRESSFYLCADPSNRSFALVRRDLNSMTFLDKNGKELFRQDLVISGEPHLQYFNFGMGAEFFVLTDRIQEFSYIFTTSGKLVGDRPIESGFPVNLHYDAPSGKYKVITVYGELVLVFSFQP